MIIHYPNIKKISFLSIMDLRTSSINTVCRNIIKKPSTVILELVFSILITINDRQSRYTWDEARHRPFYCCCHICSIKVSATHQPSASSYSSYIGNPRATSNLAIPANLSI
jgi:serine/threonine protein kinase